VEAATTAAGALFAGARSAAAGLAGLLGLADAQGEGVAGAFNASEGGFGEAAANATDDDEGSNDRGEGKGVKDAQHKHWYNLAIECEDEAKPEEALEAYERALEFKEDFAECYYNMVCRHGTLESMKKMKKISCLKV
jgi:tetratricopeptide (TPR) repeat protein